MFVGIDPGARGALCVLDESGVIVTLRPMPMVVNKPDIDLLSRSLPAYDQLIVGLELGQSMPGQGITSGFNYGYSCGMLEAMLIMLSKPYELIRPQQWTKLMHAGLSKDLSAKERSLIVAKRLKPDLSFTSSPRCTKAHDGLIDAYLIAEFIRRKHSRQA